MLNTAIRLFKNRNQLKSILDLNDLVEANTSITRTNGGKDRGYSIEATPKGNFLAINRGKRVDYIDVPQANWCMNKIVDNQVT